MVTDRQRDAQQMHVIRQLVRIGPVRVGIDARMELA
jgi:hypothetical protein